MSIQEVVNHTNKKIESWYKDIKIQYGVMGVGKCHYNKDGNKMVVVYTEDGKQMTWEMAFYSEYLSNDINWVFDCWSELV